MAAAYDPEVAVIRQARTGIGHDGRVTARNGEHGYGWVTKVLHWLTFGLVVAQFVVGYLMDDDGGGHGRGRGRVGAATAPGMVADAGAVVRTRCSTCCRSTSGSASRSWSSRSCGCSGG